jgi:tetratricopeptide (TPR) repeat protein
MSKKRSVKKGKTKKVVEVSGSNYRWPMAILFFVTILTIIAYFRSLHGPLFLDDLHYLRPSRLKSIMQNVPLSVRSISLLSLALNYHFSGMNFVAFRITNIILHIFSGLLASYLTFITLTLNAGREGAQKSGEDKTPLHIALLVAVLFLLHPIQTSAVNYITQRMAIMAAMFSFAGLIAYAKGATNTGRSSIFYFAVSALSFGLAMFSKENAVMVLPMVVVYDLVFLSAFKWNEFKRRFIPLSVLLVVLIAAAGYFFRLGSFVNKIVALFSNLHQPIKSYAWSGVDIRWTPIEYVLTELRVVSRYIFLVLVPLPSLMVSDYSNAYPVSKSLFDPLTTLLSLLFLAFLLIFSLKNIKKVPLVSFGILWYLVTISLESFIALGLDPYFEHRNYMPSYGLFLAIAFLLVRVDKVRINIRREVIIVIVAVLLFFPTFVRNGVWTKEEYLWKDAAEKVPGNARALISLSTVFIREGRFQEAQQCIETAGKVRPLADKYRIDMLFNQASIYKETNRNKQALAVLRDMEAQNPLSPEMQSYVHFFMGDLLRREGDLPQAKKYLEDAYGDEKLRLKTPVLVVTLGVVSRSLGEVDKAEGYFREAVEIEPNLVIPYVGLGDIYLAKNDLEKAEINYRQVALRKGPVHEDMRRRALFGLAQIALMKNENEKAAGLFEQVLRVAPGFYPSYIFLGGIYVKENDPDRALSYLEKALSFKGNFMKNEPNTKMLYYYLGRAYFLKGDRKRAKENLDAFSSIAAGDKRLRRQLAKAKEELAVIRGR